MSDILTSIHGRRLGLDNAGALVCPGGFVSGSHGSQFFAPNPNKVQIFDDFLGDTLDSRWNFVEGTDSATSAAALTTGAGGILLLTTGDAGTGYAADAEQMNLGALQFRALNGGLRLITRLQLSAITTCYAFIGFTDVTTLEAPIVSAASANTLTSNASDAAGFMFDTNMADDNWWLVGVDTDVDATHQDTGFAPVAATDATFEIDVDANGVATFFYNGNQVGHSMTGAITPATLLTPIITVSKLSVAASMTMSIDYVGVEMNRS